MTHVPSESLVPGAAQSHSTTSNKVDVAILIVSYNGRDYLDDCLRSIFASDDGPITKRVILVDNASQDGAVPFVRDCFPEVVLIEAESNLGFAAANNLAWRFVNEQCPGVEFVYLLNQDTIVENGWLRPIVDYMRSSTDVGCVQSKLMLHPATSTINTAGNRSHYLGFGFLQGFGEPDAAFSTPRSINYASGAAAMVRADLLKTLGLFEPEMFMYLEDADLSWKIRQFGYDVRLVPDSRVYHKYRFHNDYRFYYHLERNRWWLLLVYYRLATLILLLPALLFMEFGQCLFALWHHKFFDKLRANAYFMRPRNIAHIARLRRQSQQRRKLPDREFLSSFTGTIETTQLSGFLIRRVVNPIFGAYWAIVRRLISW